VSSAIAPTVAVGPSPSKPNEGSVRTDSVVLSNPIPSEGVSIRSQDQAHVQKPDETSILAEAEKPSEQVLATTTRTEDLNPTNPETNVMKNGATVLGSGVCSTAEVSPGRVDSGSLSTPAENPDVDGKNVRMESFIEKQVTQPVFEPSMHALLSSEENKAAPRELQSLNKDNPSAVDPICALETSDNNPVSTADNPQDTLPRNVGTEVDTAKAISERAEVLALAAEIQAEVSEQCSDQLPKRSNENVVSGLLRSSAPQMSQEGQNSMASFSPSVGMKRVSDIHPVVQTPDPKLHPSVVANHEARNVAALSELARKLEASKNPNLFKNQLYRLPNGDVVPVQTYLQAANSFNLPMRANATPPEDPTFMTPPQPKRRSGLYPTGTTSNNVTPQQLPQTNQRNGTFTGNQSKQGFKLPDRTPITSSSEFPGNWRTTSAEDGSAIRRMEVDVPELSAPQNGPPKFTILEKLTLYERKRKAITDQNWAFKQKKTEENIATRYYEVKVIIYGEHVKYGVFLSCYLCCLRLFRCSV
jgi:hypothetical protein